MRATVGRRAPVAPPRMDPMNAASVAHDTNPQEIAGVMLRRQQTVLCSESESPPGRARRRHLMTNTGYREHFTSLRIVRQHPNLCSVYHVRRQSASVVAQVQRLFEEYTYRARAGQAALDFIAEVFGFDQNMALADGYRVVAVGEPDTALYDLWRYDYDQGLVFEAGTTTLTGVVYSTPEFIVAPGVADRHGQVAALAAALNDAKTVDAPGLDPDAPLLLERDAQRKSWLVGFTEPDAVPTTPAGWDELLGGNYLHLREDFVRRHGRHFGPEARQLRWTRASLSEAYIRKFAVTDEDWHRVSFGQTLSEEFIREFAGRVRWQSISGHQRVSEAFIREFQDRLSWSSVSMSQRLSEGFIREFADRLDWCYVARHQQLSEAFIAEFAGRIAFRDLDPEHPRSEAFYRAHQRQLDWGRISQQATLSEAFIRDFADQVEWAKISEYQQLSTAFVEEFAARIIWSMFSRNKNLTDEQIRHFKDRLEWSELLTYPFGRTLTEALIREHEAYIPAHAWQRLFARGWFGAEYRAEVKARGLVADCE